MFKFEAQIQCVSQPCESHCVSELKQSSNLANRTILCTFTHVRRRLPVLGIARSCAELCVHWIIWVMPWKSFSDSFFFSDDLPSWHFSIFWKGYQQDTMTNSPCEKKSWIDFSATLPGLFLQPLKNAQLFRRVWEKGFGRNRASVVSMSYWAGSWGEWVKEGERQEQIVIIKPHNSITHGV